MLPLLAAVEAGAALIKYVPSLYKLFGDTPPPAAVTRVVEIAQAVTGEAKPEVAIAKLEADPEMMAKYKDAAEARALDIAKSYLADTQNARSRDVEIQKIRGSNTRADILVVCCVIGIAACIILACFLPSLNEFGKTIVNVAIGAFLGTWAQVNNFEFGSTKDSKNKTEVISQMISDNKEAQ